MKQNLKRRPSSRKSAGAVLAGGAALAGAAAYCAWENHALTVGRYQVRIGLPEPLTIVSLADLHGKTFGGRLLSRTAALSPDLIVLPGDTVSADCRHVSAVSSLLRQLGTIAPVVMIPGNHEQRSGRLEELSARFERAGAHVLRNEQIDLTLRGMPVHLLGLAERLAVSRLDYLRAAAGRLEYPDHDAALLSLAREEGLRIVLSHFPELFAGIGERSYRRFSFDLMFSGHAHGGQVRLPGVGGLYAPGQGFLPRYDAGVYGEGPRLIVSRGLGNDSLVPRIANRPEIVCVTVR